MLIIMTVNAKLNNNLKYIVCDSRRYVSVRYNSSQFFLAFLLYLVLREFVSK